MRIGLPLSILGLLPLSLLTGQSGPVNDWLVVPGIRVGPVTATAVKTDLKRFFPHATIEDRELELDEGMVFPATMISPGTPSESLAIIWNGKTPDAHPKQIFLCRGRRRGECKWHAPVPGGDIAVGKRLLDLEALNGGPFTVQGFGWTYGGNILSWDSGKLARFDCNQSLSLAIDGERNREGDLVPPMAAAERESFSGNRPIPSTNPALRKLNPSITEMVFLFPAPGVSPCPR